jgi:hypothetical protein
MRRLEKEIEKITVSHGCTLYGFADLQGYTPGKLANFHRGISFVFQMDAWACDRYKKTHFHKFHGGHNCGICTQACPVGQKVLRK